MKIEIRKGDRASAMEITKEGEKTGPKKRAKLFETNLKRVLDFVFEDECEVQVTFEEEMDECI